MRTTLLDTLPALANYMDFPDLVTLSSCNKEFGVSLQDVLTCEKKNFLKKIFQASHPMSVICAMHEDPFLRVNTEDDLLQVNGKENLCMFKSMLTPAFQATLDGTEDLFVMEMFFQHADVISVQARRRFANELSRDFFL